MKPLSGLHVKTFIAIFVIVIFAPLGNVLLSIGMKRAAPVNTWQPSNLPSVLAGILSSGHIWLGIASLLAFFIAYLLVLSWADYSYVQPASAFSYLVVAVLGYFILGEVITPMRWLGIAIICFGVLVVGNTPPRTTGEF
jgi:drug/metabolite transporter (DMT)-like permease